MDQPTEELSLSRETVAINSCVYRNHSGNLCLTCQSLFSRPSVPTNVRLQLPLQGKLRHRLSKYCDHCALLRIQNVRASDLPWYSLIPSIAPPLDWRLEKQGPQIFHPNKITYMAAVGSVESPALELDPKLDHHKLGSVSIRPSIHSDEPDDIASFGQMRQWVQTCISEHKTCRQSSNNGAQGFLPTRLISVTGDPRLVNNPKNHNQDGTIRYTTVSHRWGQTKMPKLLRPNTEELQIRISPRYLTSTFRDAIVVTRQLSFDYVWIDALCIIQDDLDDWRKEASLMGLVYQQASCNLGAVAAAVRAEFSTSHLSEGLFQSRDPTSLDLVNIRIVRAGHDRKYWAFTGRQIPRTLSTGLVKRGWVYQERILSPRPIYFDRQLTWECSELVANEMFPQGVSYNSPRHEPRVRLPARLLPASHFNDDTVHAQNTYWTWLMLVGFYADSSLTFRSDVFPAISGLAHSFNDLLKDEYLAGIWRGDMINGLLWHRIGIPYETRGQRDRSQEYAPSWSWAAAQGHVQHGPLVDRYPPKYRCLVTIHEACVQLATSDPMGAVKDGFICMSANIRPNLEVQALADIGCLRLSEGYDAGYAQGIRNCEGTYFLAMTYSEWLGGSSVCGLIIEPTRRTPNEYERVGAFQFERNTRSEFKDFDVDNLEMQTIMLV